MAEDTTPTPDDETTAAQPAVEAEAPIAADPVTTTEEFPHVEPVAIDTAAAVDTPSAPAAVRQRWIDGRSALVAAISVVLLGSAFWAGWAARDHQGHGDQHRFGMRGGIAGPGGMGMGNRSGGAGRDQGGWGARGSGFGGRGDDVRGGRWGESDDSGSTAPAPGESGSSSSDSKAPAAPSDSSMVAPVAPGGAPA